MTMVLSEGNTALKNPVTPPGIDPETVRLVAQRLGHYATPGLRRKSVAFVNAKYSST
jgi:hypothetical protein